MAAKRVYQLVKLYFSLGLSYDEILCFLAISHQVCISKSTLKRILKHLRLSKRKDYSDILDVALYITGELASAGQLHGYRWMHLKCLHAGLNIPRDTVYHLLQLLDPSGVSSRRRKRLQRRQYVSKGPNYVWHIDSYDKLKPFGICINGCIDGFSRNMIWLEANVTNSDPKVIASYFIEAVALKGGCPQRIRADMGTENIYVEQMQMFLRRDHGDELAGTNSFMYGKSTHNQRIESFWGCLRKEMGQFWMDLFKDLASDDDTTSFCGDFLDKSLIQFCFMNLIQRDLDVLTATWNTHSISSKANNVLRGGNRPLMMYSLPELYNVDNRLCPVDEDDIQVCREETIPRQNIPCDETVKDLCVLIMEEYHLSSQSDDSDVASAKQLYLRLRDVVRSVL